MRAGILYPASKQYPAGGLQFCDGLKKATSEAGIAMSWESVDHGGSEEVVVKAAEKLLIVDDVEVLVAFLDYRVLEKLSALAGSLNKQVLVVNPGANYPLNWQNPAGDNLSFLTLQQAFSCYLSGRNTALADTTALMGMLYDAGYLQAYAFDRGSSEHGGTIAAHYYSKDSGLRPLSDTSVISQFLQAHQPASVGLIADAQSGYFFCKAMADAGYSHAIYGSPMLAEWKAEPGEVTAWPFTLEVCTAFSAQIQAHAEWCRQKQLAETPFGVLGYEAGMWLNAVWQSLQNNADITFGNLSGCLQESTLVWDATTRHYTRPQFSLRLEANTPDWKAQPLEDQQVGWLKFSGELINTPVSGWTNTYLCY